MIESKWVIPYDTEHMEIAKRLRVEVFCREQGYPEAEEMDAYDAGALHMILKVDGEWAAVGRLLQKEDRSWYIGRVAVLKDYRGQGVGDLLMRILIRKAQDLGAGDIHIDSQVQAMPFYETLGFVPNEEGTHMDGHVPHRRMVLPAGVEPGSQCGGHH